MYNEFTECNTTCGGGKPTFKFKVKRFTLCLREFLSENILMKIKSYQIN